jgi:hypothetical protein
MSDLEEFAKEVSDISAVKSVDVRDDRVVVTWWSGSEYDYSKKMSTLKDKYGVKIIEGGDDVLSTDTRDIHYGIS